jgi:hypothetical protein
MIGDLPSTVIVSRHYHMSDPEDKDEEAVANGSAPKPSSRYIMMPNMSVHEYTSCWPNAGSQ